MVGDEYSEKLYFSTLANLIGNGLVEQLTGFVQRQPDTNLIIIDTLQKVRTNGTNNYSYSNDYEVITSLKKFADTHGICLLLIHHTRKQKSDDNFDMISGTNGLLGAADGAFILQSESRTSIHATLEVSGRDQQDQKLYLVKNTETLAWELERAETELWKEPTEPVLDMIAQFITSDNPNWQGSPTELVKALNVDLKANTLSAKLNINAGKLRDEYNIIYENNRCHDGRKISFHLI